MTEDVPPTLIQHEGNRSVVFVGNVVVNVPVASL